MSVNDYTVAKRPDGPPRIFFVHYEIDDNTSRNVLKLDKYGGDEVDTWVLLEVCA